MAKTKLDLMPGQGLLYNTRYKNPNAPAFRGQMMAPTGEFLSLQAWFKTTKGIDENYLSLKIEPLVADDKPDEKGKEATLTKNCFSSNMRRLRYLKGFTQDEVANALSISRSNVGAYEEGRAVPKFDRLIQIAEYFNITVDSLLKEFIIGNE
jgi:DNA-binding XRE family transcriptional regulator